MKVIGYKNIDNSGPSVFLMADSSLLKDGKPFFVPGFAEKIVMRPAIVLHIDRLGKNIAYKFADRYFDSVSVGLSLKAVGLDGDLQYAFDGAAIMGDFMPLDVEADLEQRIVVNDEEVSKCSLEKAGYDFRAIIEYLSKYVTMKIGDYIFCIFDELEQPAVPGLHIEGFLNDSKLLTFKTK